MSDANQTGPISTIHLRAPGCSLRAVRYRVLDADMIGHLESQVSHSIDDNATAYDFGNQVTRMAIEQMIVEVSEPGISRDRYLGKADGAKPVEFRKVTPDELHNSWTTLFNAKDTAILCRVHNAEHTVSKDELDDIFAGKVTAVP